MMLVRGTILILVILMSLLSPIVLYAQSDPGDVPIPGDQYIVTGQPAENILRKLELDPVPDPVAIAHFPGFKTYTIDGILSSFGIPCSSLRAGLINKWDSIQPWPISCGPPATLTTNGNGFYIFFSADSSVASAEYGLVSVGAEQLVASGTGPSLHLTSTAHTEKVFEHTLRLAQGWQMVGVEHSPTGRFMTLVSESARDAVQSQAIVVDAENGQVVAEIPGAVSQHLGWSADDRYLLIVEDGGFEIIDSVDGSAFVPRQLLESFEPFEFIWHPQEYWLFAIGLDLASNRYQIMQYDVETDNVHIIYTGFNPGLEWALLAWTSSDELTFSVGSLLFQDEVPVGIYSTESESVSFDELQLSQALHTLFHIEGY